MNNTTLVLSNIFPPATGGSGRWLWEIYRRQQTPRYVIAAGEHGQPQACDRKVAATFRVPDSPHTECADYSWSHDSTVIRTPMSLTTWGTFSLAGILQYSSLYRRIRRIATVERIQRCHCATLLPEGWIAWLLKKRRHIPYITYVHGEELGVGQTSRQLNWMMRTVLGGADCIIANSQNTYGMLVEQWQQPASKLCVMNPGVDAQRFRPASRDLHARQQLGWDDRPVVLTAGRLQERKGHSHLIRAMQSVRQAIPGVLYSIVGDGEQRATLQQLVAQLGLESDVQFLGKVDDEQLIRCYQQCDVFVLPNREVDGDFEGFGMVLVEAQSCGKPVIAGRSGGTAETLISGDTGILIDCSDTDVLAREVIGMLACPNQLLRMGEAARTWAATTFDWDMLAAAAEQIFDSVNHRRQTKSPGELSAPCISPD